MSLANGLAVMAGGALGSLARYVLAAAAQPISRQLPWGTILINVAGSLLIGLIAGAAALGTGRLSQSEPLRLFLMVGVCGGFTTFSSFSLQTAELMRTGATGRALANVALSVLLCLAAVAAGQALAGLLGRSRV